TTWVGKRMPLHATSDGKVLLAFGTSDLSSDPLEPLTKRTITSRDKLALQLRRVRSNHWAAAVGELEVGLNGVASPIFDGGEQCVAALSVSGPSYRVPPTRFPDWLARESVMFDHHVISSFPTMPARADFLAGQFAYTFMGWEPLPSHLDTLPGLLSEAGYLSVGIVDTPFYIRDGYGYDRGFDDFIWVRGQGDDTRPAERLDARSTWVCEADRLVARTMSAAERWLERHYKEQFFLYVDTWDPHEPWDAPEYYTALYKPDYDGRTLYPSYGR